MININLFLPTLSTAAFSSRIAESWSRLLSPQVPALTLKLCLGGSSAPSGGYLRCCCSPATLSTSTRCCATRASTHPSPASRSWPTRTRSTTEQWRTAPPCSSSRHREPHPPSFPLSHPHGVHQRIRRLLTGWPHEMTRFCFPRIPSTPCTAASTSTWSAKRATCPPCRRGFTWLRRGASPSSGKPCPWTWPWLGTASWPGPRRSSPWGHTASPRLGVRRLTSVSITLHCCFFHTAGRRTENVFLFNHITHWIRWSHN